MSDVIIYYLRCGHHSEEHRRKISVSMKRYYTIHPMTDDHKRKISEGQLRAWAFQKQCWREQGLI